MEATDGATQPTWSPEDYTVGWICLHFEDCLAAELFLDNPHQPESVSPHDINAYVLGKIGGHNIVTANLPMGNFDVSGRSAGMVAGDMLASFPNIKIALVTGIGGAAPSSMHSIKLGDVVVSAPLDVTCNEGVSQNELSEGMRERNPQMPDFAVQLPTLLRTVVDRLKAHYEIEGHQIEETISSVLEKYPHLGECRRPEGTPAEDKLSIHYGSIVSGGEVTTGENDVLCVDTAVAGLMKDFPCFAIRGICDDSDPDKKWHGYAAMAAAAVAKDLLNEIPPSGNKD